MSDICFYFHFAVMALWMISLGVVFYLGRSSIPRQPLAKGEPNSDDWWKRGEPPPEYGD